MQPPPQFDHPICAWAALRARSRGKDLAAAASARGLAVTRGDAQIPIPIGAIPVVLDEREIAARAATAVQLVSATAKAAAWRMAGNHREAVLASLGGTERRLVLQTWDRGRELAVARVDFLPGDALQALEVNATIPAMQGYSDIAAHAWLRAFAPEGIAVEALVAANGSNAGALLAALADLHRNLRGEEAGSIGLLCRRGDAQHSELVYLRDRMRDAGLVAHVVHPDQLQLARGYLHFDGAPLQLVYRHLFISRLDGAPSPDIEAALSGGADRGSLVLNRPAPHLEMKSTLAVVSQSGDEDALAEALGLCSAERAAIRAAVPWTRTLDAGLAAEAREQIAAAPDDFVLKRSWSYGGTDVFIGRAHRSEDFLRRVQKTFPGVATWRDLVARAAADHASGGFVVQRAVQHVRSRQFLCTPGDVVEASVTTDYAAFASLGTSPPWSGVCRASTSEVVNIVGGGGVVPIVRREVADRLVPALAGSVDAQAAYRGVR